MIREEQLQEWRDKLKAEQDRLEPILTFERMGELIGRDKWAMRHVLKLMEQRGMVEPVKFGLKKRYSVK